MAALTEYYIFAENTTKILIKTLHKANGALLALSGIVVASVKAADSHKLDNK